MAAAALVALVAASPASADPYVALGDSVGAGVGASSSSRGYVGLLYSEYRSALGADQLLNRSVSGATSTSLISGGQLATALADIDAASDTKAVTIEIGGNDYLTHQCTTNWDDPSTCPFRANLASILGQLRTALAADPGDEAFAVMAYYNPGAGTASEAGYETALLGANHTVGLSDTGADVGGNDVIYQEAGKLGIAVADPYAAFQAGGQSLISGDHLHPNDAGYAAIAQAFCDAAPSGCSGPLGPGPPDTQPPETEITRAPPSKIERHRVRYRFASSEDGSSFECRLDRGEYAPCTSPKTVKHLDHGRHTFRVRARDVAANTDPSAAVDRFRVVSNWPVSAGLRLPSLTVELGGALTYRR